jgi:small conductance mechanosensitive channel
MDPELLTPNAAVAFGELLILGVVAWLAVFLTRLVLRALAGAGPEGGGLMTEKRAASVHAKVAQLIRVLAGVGALALVAYNVWLTWAGYNAWELILAQFGELSAARLAVIAAQIVGLVVLLELLAWIGGELQQWLVARMQAARIMRVSDDRIDVLGEHLRHLITAALWLIGATAIVGVLNLPDSAAWWITYLIMLPVVWALMRLISDAVGVAIDAIYEGFRESESLTWSDSGEGEVRKVLDSVKIALRWGVYVAAAAYVVGAAPLGPTVHEVANDIMRAVAIILGAQVVLAIATAVVAHFASGEEDEPIERRQRQETMLPLISSLLRYAIYFVAAVMALQAVGVEVTAILAGAGIVGLAVGFGAQNLVEDIISGFFILFEGDYMVGDFIEIGPVAGTVEELTLRETTIRRRDGALAIMSNGQMDGVINYSKRFVKAVVDVGVSYEGDLNHAIEVLEEVARDARDDIPAITGPPTSRVLGFNASDIGLRLLVPVKAGKHWDVGCELRRRVKVAFDENGVEIPFARQVVLFQTPDGEPLDELPVRLVEADGYSEQSG